MYADGPNPTKIQVTPSYKRANPPAPLVLIHDGGGTTFGYFILGNLYREVWAIHNPHYFDGGRFEGGMDEMARLYIQNMYDTGLKGTIMLGGWSLGGYLSITIARMLAEDPEAKINVAGIVMMDTPYHIPYSQIEGPTDDPEIPGIPKLIQKAFDRCDEMLENWAVPSWEAPTCGDRTAFFGVGGRRYNVAPGKVLHKPVQGTWKPIDVTQYKHEGDKPEKSLAPPPTVLIRCVSHMPLPEGRTERYLIDKYRDDLLLGWGGNYPDFIKAVIDVDSNHYGMFDKDNDAKMKNLTTQLNESLEILDSIGGVAKGFGGRPAMDFF